jgi:hypothetical protein
MWVIKAMPYVSKGPVRRREVQKTLTKDTLEMEIDQEKELFVLPTRHLSDSAKTPFSSAGSPSC